MQPPHEGGSALTTRRAPPLRSGLACLALGVGLGGIAGGCGDSDPSQPPGHDGPLPPAVEVMKKSMRERSASLKGRPGGPGRRH